jgi:Asparaginase, N-terminal
MYHLLVHVNTISFMRLVIGDLVLVTNLLHSRSSCMGPKEWANIATDIETNYLEFDGFVVIMGTDTMAYCGSALSFMLENLGKCVSRWIDGSLINFKSERTQTLTATRSP